MKNYSNILFCSILLSCIEKKYPLKKRKEKKRKKNVVFKGQAINILIFLPILG